MSQNAADARIGRMVKIALDLRGMDQKALAAAIGMKAPTLGNKINGTRPWKAVEVEQVAAELRFPLAWFQRTPEELITVLNGPETQHTDGYAADLSTLSLFPFAPDLTPAAA
jgi:transcriptional regulator with XRE-family HTH domain